MLLLYLHKDIKKEWGNIVLKKGMGYLINDASTMMVCANHPIIIFIDSAWLLFFP